MLATPDIKIFCVWCSNMDAKIVLTLEPLMITELVHFLQSCNTCKISLITKLNSARLKQIFINSGIAFYNQEDNSISGLVDNKFKNENKKVPSGEEIEP